MKTTDSEKKASKEREIRWQRHIVIQMKGRDRK